MDISLHSCDDGPELERLIRQTPNAKQRDRFRAIALSISGETTPQIMCKLGRSRGFVQRWCYVYRDRGLAAVKPNPPPGRPTKLPAEQHEAFKRRVLAGPTQADGVCALRGRDFIRILKEEFDGCHYGLSGVYNLLHHLGLSVLVPRPQHRKSDPEAMKAWTQAAPFLSKNKETNTPVNTSPSGSKTKPG